jgi:hypothetical protein
MLNNNFFNLDFFAKNINDEDSAFNLYMGLYLTTLEKALNAKNFDSFLKLEAFGYSNLVKKFESKSHYERCFKIFDQLLDSFFQKNFFKKRIVKTKKNKIAFFIHNLSSTMAHIDLFCDFIKSLDKENFRKYKIDIFSIGKQSVSQKLKNIFIDRNINVYSFEDSNAYQAFEKLINFYISGEYRNLIFLSVPNYLSYLSKCLPGNVSWWVMKFPSNSYLDLKHKYVPFSFKDNLKIEDNNTFFYKNLSNFNNIKLENCIFSKKKIKFYSINREEKIRNDHYLNCVKSILNKFKNSSYSWTGKVQDDYITNFFKVNNLNDRVFYLGWIDVDKRGLKHGDIFLDTPNLSGLISAQTFASGIPTVFFVNSNFYLNYYKNELKKNNFNNLIYKEIIDDWYSDLRSSEERYINIVNKLTSNENYHENYIKLSRDLTKKYLSSPNEVADNLFAKMVC